jgi:proteasome accessory factor B
VDFDSKTYFDSGFGIYTGEVFQVKLQFFPPTSDYIAERTWHPAQKITRLEDKSLILEMPANSLSEMKKFVLSYGAKVKVLEPGELVDLVRCETKQILEIYE